MVKDKSRTSVWLVRKIEGSWILRRILEPLYVAWGGLSPELLQEKEICLFQPLWSGFCYMEPNRMLMEQNQKRLGSNHNSNTYCLSGAGSLAPILCNLIIIFKKQGLW